MAEKISSKVVCQGPLKHIIVEKVTYTDDPAGTAEVIRKYILDKRCNLCNAELMLDRIYPEMPHSRQS